MLPGDADAAEHLDAVLGVGRGGLDHRRGRHGRGQRQLIGVIPVGRPGGIGQLGLMAATRNAPANRVGPIQYSQMIWAVILGALFFSEYPDWISVCGIALVCVSGLFVFLRDDPAHRPTG